MKNKIVVFMLAFVLVLGLVVACAPKPAPLGELKPMSLSIGTGGVGGVYYPYGGGLAEIITKNIPGFKATAEVTAASVANVRMVQTGALQLALVMDDTAWEAYEGKGKFAAEGKLENLRSLFQMYPNYYKIVTLKEYPIYKIEDLKGKRVSIGAPGSGTELKFINLITALGMTRADFKESRLSFAEQVTALKDKTIDAGCWSVALGASTIIDIATTHDIRIIPFSPEEQKKITTAFPFYFTGIVPKGTYRGVTADVPTLWVGNTVVAHKDLPDRAAYEIVKAVFDPKNLEYLRIVHSAAKDTVLERAAIVPIPLHPGAERFFKEKGVLKK